MMRVAEYFDGRFKSVGERWFSRFVGCGLWVFCNARDANVSLGGCVQSNVVVYQQLCRMFAAEGG